MIILKILLCAVLLLLVYTYLIYPMFAVLIGAGLVEYWSDELPKVSVLVPAHNEATVIETMIKNFQLIDYPQDRIELVIFDDGSSDGTAAIVQNYTNDRIRLIHGDSRGGKAAGMNRLVESADYSLLLFSDANVMLSRGAVRRMVEHLADERVGAVTGEVRLIGSDMEFSAGERLYYWLERRIQGAESRIGSVMGVDGAMYLLRRELYQVLPEDTILDDFLVSINVMRARRRIVYENAAKATESGTPSARQEYARRVRITAGAVQLLKRWSVPRWSQPVLWLQFISHKLLRWVSPILLLVLFVCNAMLIGENQLFNVMFTAQLIVCSLIASAYLIRSLRKTMLGGVLFYFGLSQTAMAAGIIKGIFNLQPAQWVKGDRGSTVAGSVANGTLPSD